MARLVECQIIVRDGHGAATRYRLADRLPTDAVEDPRSTLALDIARREGRVTRAALAQAAGVPDRTATRILVALVHREILMAVGGIGRAAGYGLRPGH